MLTHNQEYVVDFSGDHVLAADTHVRFVHAEDGGCQNAASDPADGSQNGGALSSNNEVAIQLQGGAVGEPGNVYHLCSAEDYSGSQPEAVDFAYHPHVVITMVYLPPTSPPPPSPPLSPPPGTFDGKPALQAAVDLWCSDEAAAREAYGDISGWDVSAVADMSFLFHEKSTCNPDIGSWDVSGVTSMESMFLRASSFNRYIGAWDVSAVKSMRAMFAYTPFNQEIGSWDASAVVDMTQMFYRARSFRGDIGLWDVSAVKEMKGMFWDANNFGQDISMWDTSAVIDMSLMFAHAPYFDQE